jgi:hypothetical protein
MDFKHPRQAGSRLIFIPLSEDAPHRQLGHGAVLVHGVHLGKLRNGQSQRGRKYSRYVTAQIQIVDGFEAFRRPQPSTGPNDSLTIVHFCP